MEHLGSVKAIYRLQTDKNTKILQPKNLECTSIVQRKSDWTEEVRFNKNYDDYMDKFFHVLFEVKDMWDGHLDWVNDMKHNIKLIVQDARSTHSASYCAELRVRELERDGIHKMMTLNVIKPVRTEWAALIEFAT